MTPAEKAQLNEHVQAIAKLLVLLDLPWKPPTSNVLILRAKGHCSIIEADVSGALHEQLY
jgi:hypothetical protein